MSRNESYSTKQKNLIMEVIKYKKAEFTVKDIYNEIKNEVGLTTIYRLVDKLVDSKILNKYIGKDNITYYQYLEECSQENHFYLKCNNCGDILHIDCDCIDDLSNHIYMKHKFKLSKDHIIINGICQKCMEKSE